MANHPTDRENDYNDPNYNPNYQNRADHPPNVADPEYMDSGNYHPDYQREQQLRAREREEQQLAREEQRLAVARRQTVVDRAIAIIYFLVGALEVLLLIRFFLRLFGANPDNQFAQVIYDFSAPFVAPFSTLFISPTFGGGASIFDVNLLVAMIVYALLGWLVGRLIQLIWGIE
ncbi:MAG: YggT family protein [Thainema sp.]